MRRGSAYVRLSVRAGETNLSKDGMIAECRALAARENVHLIAVHVDDGKSGAIRDRPEFVAWLNDFRQGRADVMVASHADRLTREGVNAAAMVLDAIEGKDATTGAVVRPPVRFISTDGMDSEKDAEAFRWRFVIAAEVGRAERERIRQRNINNRRRLREAGRHAGGSPAYGTRVIERDGGKYLARDEAEAAVLENVARMLLAGQPMMAALRWLAAEGIKTRQGKPWSSRSLRTNLSSDGVRDHVFDPATFLALQRRLSPGADNRKTMPGRPPIWLLARGNGVCAKCGSKLSITYTRGHPRYNCLGLAKAICGGGNTIAADPIDRFIESEYLAIHESLPVVEIVTHWPGQEELGAAVEARDEALRALRQQGKPTREAFDAYEAAEAAVTHWEDVVRSSEPIATISVADGTEGDRWRAASREDRWLILQGAIAEPITLAPGSQGGNTKRGTVDPSRLTIQWAVETEAPTPNQG